MDKRKRLISLSVKYHGDYNRIIKAIAENEEVLEYQYQKCLTIFDEDYPQTLRDLKYPPLVLFYKGNLELLKENSISVVGSRKPCDYALKATKDLCLHYKDKVIVSGLAKGIDAAAHRYATRTIGVIGCGIDYVYPYCNKDLYKKLEKEGLILSEYPGITKPLAYHFPFRNRIIAALSNTVYIMQSSQKSGTMSTINEALELGRDVKVLPYDIYSLEGEHNNHLINEGALMIEKEETV